MRPIRTNALRCVQATEISDAPDPESWRVLCLGASTTENSIWHKDDPAEYSYPLCLEAYLASVVPNEKFEVINCGVGGWTTAEILVNFALHLVETRPHVVILYSGLNDLEASLTQPFMADYSHSRRNFGEAYARIRLASRLPSFTHWKSYAYAKGRLLGFGNMRHDVLSSIRAGTARLDNPFAGLKTERRNIEQLVTLCLAAGSRVVLSTFAYHIYAEVEHDRRVLRYQQGVQEENAMVRDVARMRGLPLVDIAESIDKDDALFVDSVHFTPRGMQFLGRAFGDQLIAMRRNERSDADPATTSQSVP